MLVNAIVLLAVLLVGLTVGWRWQLHRESRRKREDSIRHYVFRRSLFDSLARTHPALDEKDWFLVARALRCFFLIHLRTAPATIGMPSRVVDDLWHAFILDTRAYHDFCVAAFGEYFHHVPAANMAGGLSEYTGLDLTWRYACLEENINPTRPVRVPLLFAIDKKLNIPEGNMWDTAHATEAFGPAGSSGALHDWGGGCGGGGGSGQGSGCGGGSGDGGD